jgi:hypothetical protein
LRTRWQKGASDDTLQKNRSDRPKIMSWWLKGAIGLAKAWTGVDRADQQTVLLRRLACLDCLKRHKRLCMMCGCYLREKTLVASEHCPLRRW